MAKTPDLGPCWHLGLDLELVVVVVDLHALHHRSQVNKHARLANIQPSQRYLSAYMDQVAPRFKFRHHSD